MNYKVAFHTVTIILIFIIIVGLYSYAKSIKIDVSNIRPSKSVNNTGDAAFDLSINGGKTQKITYENKTSGVRYDQSYIDIDSKIDVTIFNSESYIVVVVTDDNGKMSSALIDTDNSNVTYS